MGAVDDRRRTHIQAHRQGDSAQVSASTVVRAFTKAGIMTELPGNGSNTELNDNDKMDPGILDAVLAQLLNSNTENEDFEGFMDKE